MGTGLPSMRDDAHFVAGEGDAAVFDGAGVAGGGGGGVWPSRTRMGSPEPRALSLMEYVVEPTSRPSGSVPLSRSWVFRACGPSWESSSSSSMVPVKKGSQSRRARKCSGVVAAGVFAVVDEDKAELSGVGAFVQVVHGHGVGVVPAECRPGQGVSVMR